MSNFPKILCRLLLLPALLAMVTGACVLPASAQQPIPILAGDAPPFVIEAGNEGQGLILDMVVEAARRAGHTPQVTFMPWKRAQEMGAAGQDMLLVPLARTQQQESRYTWVAPLLRVDHVLVGLNQRADSLEQAWVQRLRVIVSDGSLEEQALKDAKYPSDLILSVPRGTKELDMLRTGRGDVWLTGALQAAWRWKLAGYQEPLVFGGVIKVETVYLACSSKCDPSLVAGLAKAVESMRRDGTIGKIQRHYIQAR